MIAASQGGETLIFTCMKMGDGDSSGVEIMELEDLLAPKITINISSIDTNGTPGQVSLTATVNNAELDNGFFTKELGVFAKIGDNGVERLYAYTNAGSYADYMPSKATPIDENTIRATMVVANNANTTAIINSSVVFLTAAEVDSRISEHNTATDAHKDILHLLQRNKSYIVNDIAHNANLPSWLCLRCIQAGTTGDTVPTLTDVTEGNVITDGTVKWLVSQIGGSTTSFFERDAAGYYVLKDELKYDAVFTQEASTGYVTLK